MNRIKGFNRLYPTRFILLIFLVSFFVLAIVGIYFSVPGDAYAHPAYGFTPDPPPPPPPPPGGGGGGDDDGRSDGGGDSTDDDIPTDYVWVQLEHCDLSCSAGYAEVDDPPVLLASISDTALQLLSPVPADNITREVEVLTPVRLIHRGSGFIVEGTLSDAAGARFPVPYDGEWEIFMVEPPQFATAELMDLTGLNVAQLQADLANAPLSLGMVEANSPGPQMVKCPIACVIETPPEQSYLPVTGADKSHNPVLLVVDSVFLLIICVLPLAYRVIKKRIVF